MIAPALPDAPPTDVTRLHDLEQTIERGIATFVEVGSALAEIRDSKLYRWTHDTFADYCEQRWSMTVRRARQLMDSADLSVQLMGTMVPTGLTERTLRPLAGLPEEKRTEAVDEVRQQHAEGVPIKAAIKAAVASRTAPPPEIEPEENEEEETDLVAELQRAYEENAVLRQQVEQLSASDVGKEILALNAKYAQLNGRLIQLAMENGENKKQATSYGKILQKIRKELGVESNSEILDAIFDLKR